MIIPPVLTPLEIDLIMALISIGYGMTVECHYTPWYSVVLNVILTAFFLGSNALPLIALIVLVIYVAIGFVVAKFSLKRAYSLFGTKTFGALTLTASLYSLGFLNWLVSALISLNARFNFNLVSIDSIYLFSWLIIGIVVHVLGWYYFGRED